MFKAFSQPVRQIIDPKTGEVLDKTAQSLVLQKLKNDVVMVTELAEHALNNDDQLLNDLENLIARDNLGAILNHNAKIAQYLKIKLPEAIKEGRKSGNSRLEHIYQHKVISETKSWLERVKAARGVTDKWVSSGWKRTADATAPSNLKPKISLSAGAVQYAQIINNVVSDGRIDLKLVINGSWYLLVFNMPEWFERVKKVTLPDVSIDANGELKFNFTVEIESLPIEYSAKYVIGVDVGVSDFVVVSVVDSVTRKPVYSSTVSRSAQSLSNSVKATKAQVKHLHFKKDSHEVFSEIVLQRDALKRKRRELAIQVAQEVIELSRVFDHAIIVVEDLSHIKNTMKFGHWSRGELVKWLNSLSEATDSKVYSVNAAYSSQDCSVCGERGSFSDYKIFVCKACGFSANRDVNAATNIALRFMNKSNKAGDSTLVKVRKLQVQKQARKNPRRVKPSFKGGSRNVGHGHVGKNKPTPRQVVRVFKAVKNHNPRTVMNNLIHTVITDDLHFGSQDSNKAALIIFDKQVNFAIIYQE